MGAMRRQDGFTLVELMVVVLIIAILIAIAIPTFVGLRSRAFDRAAQTGAVTGLKAAKVIYSDSDSYAAVTLPELKATEVALDYVDGGTASSGPAIVSVHVPDPSAVVVSAYSLSGTCYLLRDDGNGTTYATLTTATADCYAANGAVSFGLQWP